MRHIKFHILGLEDTEFADAQHEELFKFPDDTEDAAIQAEFDDWLGKLLEIGWWEMKGRRNGS